MRPMPPPLGPSVRRGALGPPPNSNFPKLVVLDEARWRWVEGEGARGPSSGPNVESLAPFAPRLRALLRALLRAPACGPWETGGVCEALPGIWNREAGRSGGLGVHRGLEAGAGRHPVGAAGRSKKRQATSSPTIFVRPVPDIPSQRSRQRSRDRSRQACRGATSGGGGGAGGREACEGGAGAPTRPRPPRELRAPAARPPRREGGGRPRPDLRPRRELARREGGRGPPWRGPALRPPPPPPPP